MLSDKSSHSTRNLVLLILAAIVGVAARLWLASHGHNFDMDSWQIAADLFINGKNVYVGTYRYPYGPVWFIILGGLRHLHDLLGMSALGPESFHLVVAGFLSLVDVAIAVLLYRAFGLAAGIFMMLNPVSILLTGYHSQIDQLAVLPALCAWMILCVEDRPNPNISWLRLIFAALLLGVSLATKHLMIFFPIWLLISPTLISGLARRIIFTLLAYGFLVASFVPFLFEPRAAQAIYKHVITYGSYSTSALMPRIVDLFIPIKAVNTLFGFTNFDSGVKMLFAICMLAMGRVAAKAIPERLFYCYLICVVVFASIMADQYLAIPIVACAVYLRRWPVWIYTVLSAGLVSSTAQLSGVLPGSRPWFYAAFGNGLNHYHATAWLAILLISVILRTGGWSLFFRKEQERLDLGKG